MTFLKYEHFNFSEKRQARIELINEIISEYAAQGIHSLSVRQIYYQLVARDVLPNTASEYNQIGNLISDARMAGLISWRSIVDRNRQLYGVETFDNVDTALKEMRSSYKRDLWQDQDWYPVVGVEKAALEGVVGSICTTLRVDYIAFRGYNSQSQAWELGQRFANAYREGRRPILFYLGDRDPSGMDMTRDHQKRLNQFCGAQVIVQRLALNQDQIDEYDPPPNPAKETDSRYEAYRAEFGDDSFELDALDPRVIQELIRDAVMRIRDEAKWDVALSEEVEDLRHIDAIIREHSTTEDEDSNDE